MHSIPQLNPIKLLPLRLAQHQWRGMLALGILACCQAGPPPSDGGAEPNIHFLLDAAVRADLEPLKRALATESGRREICRTVDGCADTYVPGPPYCTYGPRVAASCVLYVPEAQGSLVRGRHHRLATPRGTTGLHWHHRWATPTPNPNPSPNPTP